MAATDFSTANAAGPEWEPFMIDGVETGQKNVLHAGENGYFAAFWRVGEDDHGEFDSTARMTTTVLTIEGRVQVEIKGGETIELGPGDALTLPQGNESHWKVVERPYKELFAVGG
jgi:uncharacterized cupin superfamily protein